MSQAAVFRACQIPLRSGFPSVVRDVVCEIATADSSIPQTMIGRTRFMPALLCVDFYDFEGQSLGHQHLVGNLRGNMDDVPGGHLLADPALDRFAANRK